jgi:hypothetical protein
MDVTEGALGPTETPVPDDPPQPVSNATKPTLTKTRKRSNVRRSVISF